MVEPKNNLDELIKKGLIKKGDDPSLAVVWESTGIAALDELFGGGIPFGRFMLNYGPESNGKTLLGQYMVAAVQKTSRPLVLYMDLENSYDKVWWDQSGVDTEKLLVSNPATAEEAVDIIVAMLRSSNDLGMIFVDSIAGMVPEPEMDPERSTSDKNIGRQAAVVTLMYRKIKSFVNDKKVFFYSTNQMRESIGVYDELKALPGGRAQRHYSHIIIKTAREGWIKDGDARVGFDIAITSKKNKLCKTADGTEVLLPFMFNSQIDIASHTIKEAIKIGLIAKAGPYYKLAGKSFLGMENLRGFLAETPEEMDLLIAGTK